MTLVHAWFSSPVALVRGSWAYRKPSGAIVNVTRTSPSREGKTNDDEKYVGEVISAEDGGCVQAKTRVRGITD